MYEAGTTVSILVQQAAPKGHPLPLKIRSYFIPVSPSEQTSIQSVIKKGVLRVYNFMLVRSEKNVTQRKRTHSCVHDDILARA